MVRSVVILAFVMAIATACTSVSPHGPVGSVNVRYDPYNFSIDNLLATAIIQCQAKGGDIAVQTEKTDNKEEIRWSYMSFDCYRRVSSGQV